MFVVKYDKRAFCLISALICTLIVSYLAIFSFKEVSNSLFHLKYLKKNIEEKKKFYDFNIKDCASKEIHSNLVLKACKNNNYILIQK